MAIDNLAKDLEELQKYELPKQNILKRILESLRGFQVIGDVEGMKKEMGVLDNALKRIEAVIPGQIQRFRGKKTVVAKLEEQQRIVGELKRFEVFYLSNQNPTTLKETYTRIYQAIQNFITISNSIINTKAIAA